MHLSQLSKLERGDRRVDVDDLVALAAVLNVTPAQLLMPPPPDGDKNPSIQLTPSRAVGWRRAWQWVCGDFWLDDTHPPDEYADDPQDRAQAQADWHSEARPHDPFGGYTFDPSLLSTREMEVKAVVEAVKVALTPQVGKNDLRREWLHAAIDWYLTVESGERLNRGTPDRG